MKAICRREGKVEGVHGVLRVLLDSRLVQPYDNNLIVQCVAYLT